MVSEISYFAQTVLFDVIESEPWQNMTSSLYILNNLHGLCSCGFLGSGFIAYSELIDWVGGRDVEILSLRSRRPMFQAPWGPFKLTERQIFSCLAWPHSINKYKFIAPPLLSMPGQLFLKRPKWTLPVLHVQVMSARSIVSNRIVCHWGCTLYDTWHKFMSDSWSMHCDEMLDFTLLLPVPEGGEICIYMVISWFPFKVCSDRHTECHEEN